MDGRKEFTPLEKAAETQVAVGDVNQNNNSVDQNKTSIPKKNKNPFVFVLIAVIFIGLGIGAYFVINNANKTDKNNIVANDEKDNPKPPVVSLFKPADAMLGIQNAVKAKYSQVMPEGSELSGEQIYFKNSDKAPAWKISGEKIYVNYFGDGASSTDVYYYDKSDTAAASARYKAISAAMVQSLVDQKFIKDASSVYNNDGSDNDAYIKDDVLCVVNSPDSGMISAPSSIACGQISKYTKDLANYKESEPYAVAYEKAGKMSEGTMITFRSLNAGMLGYKNTNVSLGNAGMSIGGAMGLFYKTPTGEWTFFMGTQAVIDCKDFDTKDLQYAFANEQCYDSTKTGNYANVNIANYYNLH